MCDGGLLTCPAAGSQLVSQLGIQSVSQSVQSVGAATFSQTEVKRQVSNGNGIVLSAEPTTRRYECFV